MKTRIKFTILLYLIINSFNISFSNENFFNKGLEFFKDKKYDDARFMFERSIVFNPKDSNSYLYLAKIYNIEENQNKEEKNLIVGLDIGTSKIVTIVSEIKNDGEIQILGIGQHISRGLKKGVVVNIESTMQAIQRSLEEAELMADCKIKEVYTGIAGSHIRSINSTGMVKIRDLEVDNSDVERVIETAQAITLPPDQQVLHTLVQEYIIDDQYDIREPRGMSGMRLEVKVHIVSGAIAAAQNIVKCIKRSGLDVMELILQPLASADAVLTNDEKEKIIQKFNKIYQKILKKNLTLINLILSSIYFFY